MSTQSKAKGSFPTSWAVRPLREVSASRPATINPAQHAEENFEYYSIPAYQLDQRPMLAKGSEIGSLKLLLEEGTVMFGKLNPRVEKVWRVGRFTELRKIGSTEWLPLIPLDGIDGEFLYFLMWSEHVMPKAKTLVSGSTPSRQRVDPRAFYSLEAPIPPLTEQRNIAKVLGLVRRAIEQQERLITLTVELKRALLHHLFTHGLHSETQKQTEIGPIPQSWRVMEFASAVEQIDYGISAPIPKTSPENGVKIVSTADITKGGRLLYHKIRRISAPDKTVKRLTLQAGDVLFNWRNSAELIGKSAIFQEQEEPHVFASFILRIKCGEKVSHNFYLMHLMNHYRDIGVFVKLARRAVNQANYNRNEIGVLKIPLPSYKEQRGIADAVSTVEDKIQFHCRKHAAMDSLFRTLTHELMTARIRVHDLGLPELEDACKD